MRIFAFDCITGRKHLRGFMLSSDGPLMQQSVEVSDVDHPILPEHWVFDREMVARASEGWFVQKIMKTVRRRGFCITSMPPPPNTFHVTDVIMDGGTLRVYSTDRSIEIFDRVIKRYQFSEHLDLYNIKERKYLGTVDISSDDSARLLGIESYLALVKRGTSVVVRHVETEYGFFENVLLRKLNEDMARFGVVVTSVKLEEGALGRERREVSLPERGKYASLFLSHTKADKPFARRIRADLLRCGVPKVWMDEAEIKVGDSLVDKIQSGLSSTRYFGILLYPESIKSGWVKRELEIAINVEISSGDILFYQ